MTPIQKLATRYRSPRVRLALNPLLLLAVLASLIAGLWAAGCLADAASGALQPDESMTIVGQASAAPAAGHCEVRVAPPAQPARLATVAQAIPAPAVASTALATLVMAATPADADPPVSRVVPPLEHPPNLLAL
jgi:hypothetical protein